MLKIALSRLSLKLLGIKHLSAHAYQNDAVISSADAEAECGVNEPEPSLKNRQDSSAGDVTRKASKQLGTQGVIDKKVIVYGFRYYNFVR